MSDKKTQSTDWACIDTGQYVKIDSIIEITFKKRTDSVALMYLTLIGDKTQRLIIGREKIRSFLTLLDNTYLKEEFGKLFNESPNI